MKGSKDFTVKLKYFVILLKTSPSKYLFYVNNTSRRYNTFCYGIRQFTVAKKGRNMPMTERRENNFFDLCQKMTDATLGMCLRKGCLCVTQSCKLSVQ